MEEVLAGTPIAEARSPDWNPKPTTDSEIEQPGNSPSDIEARLRDTAATPLWAWRMEAMLPWADRPLMRSLVEAQIGTLVGFRTGVSRERRVQVDALIAKYRAFLAELS